MSSAPSERHLEDWIVANMSRFGTAYDEAFELPEKVTRNWHWLNETTAIEPFYSAIVARQQPFPFGRADLIATNRFYIAAVELKVGPITSETVAQCIRYMHELKQIWGETLFATHDLPEAERDQYDYNPTVHMAVMSYPQGEISGMVVGRTIADPNLLVVCAAADIQVVTYDWNGLEYTFDLHESLLERYHTQHYKRHVNGALGQAMRTVMRNKRNWQLFGGGND